MSSETTFGILKRKPLAEVAPPFDEGSGAPETPFEEPAYEALPIAALNQLAEAFRRKADAARTIAEEREWTGRERNCRTSVNRRQRID